MHYWIEYDIIHIINNRKLKEQARIESIYELIEKIAKGNKSDNMLDFPDLVKNLAKNKISGFLVMDRSTLSVSSYDVQRRKYGPNISIITFKCEGGKNYRIKYDRAKHIATEME